VKRLFEFIFGGGFSMVMGRRKGQNMIRFKLLNV